MRADVLTAVDPQSLCPSVSEQASPMTRGSDDTHGHFEKGGQKKGPWMGENSGNCHTDGRIVGHRRLVLWQENDM